MLYLATAAIAFGGKVTSFYSTTEEKYCAAISDSALENEAGMDYFEYLCPGYGGYELLFRGGDLRSWLDIRYGKTTSDLYGATMTASRGGFAHMCNEVVEWRGVLEGAVFTPYAIIYRVKAQDMVDEENKSFTRLIVVALKQGKAQVLGSTSGKNEGEKARKLADEFFAKEQNK